MSCLDTCKIGEYASFQKITNKQVHKTQQSLNNEPKHNVRVDFISDAEATHYEKELKECEIKYDKKSHAINSEEYIFYNHHDKSVFENIVFLYHDNLEFLKEHFSKVTIVNSIKDQTIPSDANSVFICGGYIETKEAYDKYKNSNRKI